VGVVKHNYLFQSIFDCFYKNPKIKNNKREYSVCELLTFVCGQSKIEKKKKIPPTLSENQKLKNGFE